MTHTKNARSILSAIHSFGPQIRSSHPSIPSRPLIRRPFAVSQLKPILARSAPRQQQQHTDSSLPRRQLSGMGAIPCPSFLLPPTPATLLCYDPLIHPCMPLLASMNLCTQPFATYRQCAKPTLMHQPAGLLLRRLRHGRRGMAATAQRGPGRRVKRVMAAAFPSVSG